MIYSVRGKVIHLEQELAVVECGGVGYACRTTLNTVGKIQNSKDEVTLYTVLHVREDAVELFGFATNDELNCFKLLTSVSGVGPKNALCILSTMTPQAFALAVATEDAKTITKAKGVGPKLAQRIVLELKDKLQKDIAVTGGIEIPDMIDAKGGVSNIGEAISALTVLGYTQPEAAKALSGADATMEVEELIKYALKRFATMK
ncbi:MAG: Holliday junction branch migration protein RuvA [Ruminococcus sp.]|nr:Holliday junction branch migration protein RuvA [Ruminococcus sp.]